ncbi:MAG: hypothetical protein DRP71_16935, partial [Verrucomicrobia bacterium]
MAVVLFSLAESRGEQAWFAGLGDLPGGDFYSSAFAVSADHRCVVGFSVSHGTSEDGREAFLWTREGGMVGLGNLDGVYGAYSGANDVSDDGRVVVGYVGNPGPGQLANSAQIRPFRWTAESGMVVLKDLLDGRERGWAEAVSANGNTIVGAKENPSGDGASGDFQLESFRWASLTGMIGLGDLPGGWVLSKGHDVSGDGTIVVGNSSSSAGQFGEMYRWSLPNGMQGLGLLNTDDVLSSATAVSADGRTVVGYVADRDQVEKAVRWTAEDGLKPLWASAGAGDSSVAYDVSGNGERIVGGFREGDGLNRAFLWDGDLEDLDLKGLLINGYGLGDALSGWELEVVNAISTDGMMVAGRGTNASGLTEAFVAYLGDPVRERPSFQGLGDLKGGVYESGASAISADGLTVVGYGNSGNGIDSAREAFRWTAAEGMVGLGHFPGDFKRTEATDISADGDVVVGFGLSSVEVSFGGGLQVFPVQRGFTWTSQTGLRVLRDDASPLLETAAMGVSENGRVAVGFREALISDIYFESQDIEATRWVDGGPAEGMGDFPEGFFSSLARDVSADGSVIVGAGSPLGFRQQAFRWTEAGGMVGLGYLNPGDRVSSGEAVTSDGSVVVGYSQDRTGLYRAYRWTEETGMAPLRDPGDEGDTQSLADDVSSDGGVVVGWYEKPDTYEPSGFVWFEQWGFRDLKEVLVEGFGLSEELAGWTLESARSVSADGTRIVGQGINPDGQREAFLAVLPSEVAFPVILEQPQSETVTLGGTVTLSAKTERSENLTFQWRLDGVDIPGANGADYTIPIAQRFHAGDYTVVVADGPTWLISEPATLTAEPPPPSGSRLLNLSTRALVGGVNKLVLPGFVIEGSGTKRLLLRAVGATLRQPPFNMTSALGDPWLMVGTNEIFENNTGVFSSIERNNDLETSENREAILEASMAIGAFPLTDERDGAILIDLPSGLFTAWISSEGGEHPGGVAIAEIYDVDEAGSETVLTNISTRGFVGLGSEVLIPGFVIAPEGSLTLLIRVVGPTMDGDPFNVSGVISNPKLTVYGTGPNGTSILLFSNDDWGDQVDAAYTEQIAAQVGAFALKTGGRDAAIVLTLPPGAYTVVGSSADGEGTGTGLV